MAAHFIHEHYIFARTGDHETYSYYGPLNLVTFNVGCHNEHHDFIGVPGSRLPELRRIAGRHYETLVSHRSWAGVLARFILDEAMGFDSRIVRSQETHRRLSRVRLKPRAKFSTEPA